MTGRCPDCPVPHAPACPGDRNPRFCHLAASEPDYRSAIVARSEGRSQPPSTAEPASPREPPPPPSGFRRVLELTFRPPRLTPDQKDDHREIALECPHRRTRPGCRKIDCRRWHQTVGLETCLACVYADANPQP